MNTYSFHYNMDMNQYPLVLTPPMSGSESSLPPTSPPMYHPLSTNENNVMQQPQGTFSYLSLNDSSIMDNIPYLEILEQPVEKFRFRYKSEMAGTHGCLTGHNSDKNKKQTFPTAKLHNYSEPAVIRCSLSQYNHNYRRDQILSHAHRLVQRHGVEEVDDPHDKKVTAADNHIAVFHNMGIIHTAKKFLVEELRTKKIKLYHEKIMRDEGRLRPLNSLEEADIEKTSADEAKSMNLNIVCLRFEAFTNFNGRLLPICKPVYSHGINNLKSALTGELKIVRMDRCGSPATGNKEIYLLVEKVTKKNVKVRFFELDEEEYEVWSEYGVFNDIDVHHQYAIVIKTPPYKDKYIEKDKKVFIELVRPSDNARSAPLSFTYYADRTQIRRKRPRHEVNSIESCYNSDIPATVEDIPDFLNLGDNLGRLAEGVDTGKFNEIILQLTAAEKTDMDINYQELNEFAQGFLMHTIDSPINSVDKEKLAETTQKYITRCYDELVSFLKTNPSDDRVTKMLTNLLKKPNDDGNNVLHLLFKFFNNVDKKPLKLFLAVLFNYKLYDLLNIINDDSETILHIAILNCCNNYVETLVKFADCSVQNFKGNTPLHLAILNEENYDLILKSKSLKKFIDIENNDGYTALQLATFERNFDAFKSLIETGADVNVIDRKTGNTLLHQCIKDCDEKMVEYLIRNTSILSDNKYNYEGFSHQEYAEKVTECTNIEAIITKISKELQEIRLSNKEYKVELKTENFEEFDLSGDDLEEIENMYQNITEITDECLKNVLRVTNESKYIEFAHQLDLEYVLSTSIFDGKENQINILIKLALSSGISLFQLRTSLKEIGEREAAKYIDRMVIKLSKSS